jgi:alanine racemase
MHRTTVAEIDLAAIRHNYEIANKLALKSRTIAVVKADAYGHGAVRVARELEKCAPALAVATLDEAIELRDGGVQCPLLILEGVGDAESLRYVCEHRLAVMVHHKEQLAAVLELPAPPDIWLKVDTGMHRLGIAIEDVQDIVRGLLDSGLAASRLVVCTHLATADDRESDFAALQIARFRAATKSLPCALSIANSAGVLAWPDSHADWNRPGYMLYGNSPLSGADTSATKLQPAMRLVSNIIGVGKVAAGETVGYGRNWTATRESTIATVAIGYADGYPRAASNGTTTLVNGSPAALVGTVSMDLITVDLSEHPGAKIGDAVILWGPELPVDGVAKSAGTIGYDLLTGVSRRVPRRYCSFA